MHSRRGVLAACVAVGTAVAGCVTSTDGDGPDGGNSGEPSDSPTETAACSAADPPRPTDAEADPRSYPDRPEDLSPEALEPFLESYERSYRYNDTVAAYPEKYGRTNEVSVRIDSVAVESREDGYTATVSGQVQTNFVHAETPTETPGTATETPLPIGHHPFETSYTITERELERNGVTRECW